MSRMMSLNYHLEIGSQKVYVRTISEFGDGEEGRIEAADGSRKYRIRDNIWDIGEIEVTIYLRDNFNSDELSEFSIMEDWTNNNRILDVYIIGTDIIGEEKAYEITESVTFTNPEFFEELNKIIMKNEDLPNRIATLKEMKDEIKFSTASNGPVVVCVILGLILVPSFITALIYYGLAQLAKDNPTAFGIFSFVFVVFYGIALGCLYLMAGLGC